MDCVATFTNESWHYTLVSDPNGKKATALKTKIKENVSNSISCFIFYFSGAASTSR